MTRSVWIVLAFYFSQIAHACEYDTSGPMPYCRFPTVKNTDRIIIIEAPYPVDHTNFEVIREYSSDFPVQTSPVRHANIEVDNLDAPVTIVLASETSMLFGFAGDVDKIRNVIVLGAKKGGLGSIGLYGINQENVQFVPVEGFDNRIHSYCVSPPMSCDYRQFLFESFDDIEMYKKHPMGTFARYEKEYVAIAAEIEAIAVQTYKISENDGQITITTKMPEMTSDTDIDFGFYSSFTNFDIGLYDGLPIENVIYYKDKSVTQFSIGGRHDIYETRWRNADLLAKWQGMSQLQDQGYLLLPDHPKFKEFAHKFEDAPNVFDPKTPVVVLKNIDEFPAGINHQKIIAYVRKGASVPCDHDCREANAFIYEGKN